jgi:hypothetical protein
MNKHKQNYSIQVNHGFWFLTTHRKCVHHFLKHLNCINLYTLKKTDWTKSCQIGFYSYNNYFNCYSFLDQDEGHIYNKQLNMLFEPEKMRFNNQPSS